MLGTIVVQTRSDFEGLFLDLHSNKFKYRVTGSGRSRVAKEILQVFGLRASAMQLAQYFYHPKRVAWRTANVAPDNYVDQGKSEIPDHTYWSCRDMFIALAGTEPTELSRMLLAEVTTAALGYDLAARTGVPSSFLEAVKIFGTLCHDPTAEDQKSINKIYKAVEEEYGALTKETSRREFQQTMRVIKMLLSHFSRDFMDSGDSLPWFNLQQIVQVREWKGKWLPLRPVLTSTDLATITQMILGVDTSNLAQPPSSQKGTA